MIKLLVKKEFKSLFYSFFINGKTGEKRKKSSSKRFIVLYILVLLFLCGIFYYLSSSLASSFISLSLDWFYFGLMGIMATSLGIFGDVFNTYQMLYEPKDNDLLLSLPIKPREILLSRMVVVFLLGYMYLLTVWLPSIVAYWIVKGWLGAETILVISEQIILSFALNLVVTSLTCLLGFIVAKINKSMKNKKILTTIVTLLFIVVYYYFCMRFSSIIELLINDAEAVSKGFSRFYPFLLFGRASSGEGGGTLLFTLFSLILFAFSFYFISHSFVLLAIKSDRSKKRTFKEKNLSLSSLKGALLKKELKRFLSSTVYSLNCGLGIIVMLILALLAIVYRGRIVEFLPIFKGISLYKIRPLVIASGISLIASLDTISASSISLEGKNYWIIQSLPITPMEIIESKINLCFLLNVVPSLVLAITLSAILSFSIWHCLAVILFVTLYDYLFASIGLVANIKNHTFEWTNEASVVKQSLAVFLTLVFGLVLSLLFPGIFLLLDGLSMSANLYILLVLLILLFFVIFLRQYLKKGCSRLIQYM